MKKSKYLQKQFGEWTCTHVGIARTQPLFYKGTKIASRRPYHNTYYYLFERVTSDGKALKQIRLNCKEAAKLYKGQTTVEEIADSRAIKREIGTTTRVNYHNI